MQTTMSTEERDDNLKMKKAREFLAHCRLTEAGLRRSLADAVESTRRAKARHDELFIACEKRAAVRFLAS